MKKIVLCSLALFLGTLLSARNMVTRSYQLEPFNAINASFIYQIEVYRGDSHTMELEIPEELVGELEINVSGKVLHLGVTREWWRTAKNVFSRNHTIRAKITMPELEGIELSNAASLYTKDGFNPSNFRIRLTGATAAEVHIMTHASNIDINGASKLEIKGLSTNTKGYVNGASTLLFNQEVAGIELQVGGASTVVMKGSASRADIRVSGASAIKATEFDTEEMKIRCSGASGAHVHVTGKIDVSVSGASDIHVKGGPEFTRSSSSGASSIQSL